MNRAKAIYGIFIITFSTILIEVLYTRVFSVLYKGQFAFLIISLALFGYGLSGVYVSLARLTKRNDTRRLVSRFLFLYALSIPLAYKVTLVLNVDFVHLFDPLTNLLALILTFAVNLLPFFFAGTTLVLIFSSYSAEIGRLYFIDLLGASLGSLAIIPLIPRLGPTRILVVLFFLLGVSFVFFAVFSRALKAATLAALLAVSTGFFLYDTDIFPVMPKLVKRYYNDQLRRGRMEYSKWNTINRIDVAPWPWDPPRKIIYIDGGTMQSFIHQFDGNVKGMTPYEWEPAAIPYQLVRGQSAFIIGSAGGFEALCALSHRYQYVVAVEMDPSICHILKNEYAGYSGNIFKLPQVKLLADEGRSALKRINQKFDVIQMVNSHTTDTLLSGALSIAETYIYTVESFKDYWEHLKPDGVIYIVHWYGERLFSTALQALREMGVPAAEKKFFLVSPKDGFVFFFLKKGEWTADELQTLNDFSGNKDILYSPQMRKSNTYYQLASSSFSEIIARSAIDISPVYDRSPYLNQTNKIGQFSFANFFVTGFASTIVHFNLVYSNSIYLSILALSVLFSLFFIFIPLGVRSSRQPYVRTALYFFVIGLAFIMVEIIYIKVFQLFLGSPAISIALIIFSLLISSGVGSLMSKRFESWFGRRFIPMFALVLALLLVAYGLFLFKVFNALIELTFGLRILISFLLISLTGLFMGNFLPFGIRRLGEKDETMIGWAWGANAFATVLGSILAVILSINWNFPVVLISAAACYLAAGVLMMGKKGQAI